MHAQRHVGHRVRSFAAVVSGTLMIVGCGGGGGSSGSISPPPPTMFAATILLAGDGSGSVASSPSGITCGSTCTAQFAQGTTVTLTAMPAANSNFVGWSNGACQGMGTCTVTVSAAQSMTATFLNASQQAGILVGAVQYVGPNSAVQNVTFTDRAGKTRTVMAFAGHVLVYFTPTTTQQAAEAAVQSSGATIIEEFPKIGYYLAQVPTGSEGSFISSVRSNATVVLAIPSAALCSYAVRTCRHQHGLRHETNPGAAQYHRPGGHRLQESRPLCSHGR